MILSLATTTQVIKRLLCHPPYFFDDFSLVSKSLGCGQSLCHKVGRQAGREWATMTFSAEELKMSPVQKLLWAIAMLTFFAAANLYESTDTI
jgi:hypothetical protein